MSLRALKELRQHIPHEDEDAGSPYDLIGEPQDPESTSLECTIYFNPSHPVADELDQLQRQLLAEIAPHYRTLYFQRLCEANLRGASPFSTRAAENRYLQRGYAHGPGLWPAREPAPHRRAGNTAHQRSREESQEALQVLALMTERALRAIRKYIPRRQRAAWLNDDVDTILAPVCGKISRGAGDEAPAPDIPLVRENGLLLGCTNFDELRTVLPSFINTPNTAAREGRGALKRWSEAEECDLYADSVTEQIRRELRDPRQHFGADFDLAGAALWMCQCVMQMRLSVEDVRRRTAASWFAHEDKEEANEAENMRLRDRLFAGYGRAGGRSVVALEAPTLTRRILEIFYGVAFDTWGRYDINNRDDRTFVQILLFVDWLRNLRLTGRATLNSSLAFNICRIIDREDDDFEILFGGQDGLELENLLGDLLPDAGWQALYEAACILLEDDADTSFAVTYGWRGLTEHGPSGHVDPDERRIEIVGPLLMLPLHAADYWRDKARRIPAEGLYAYVE